MIFVLPRIARTVCSITSSFDSIARAKTGDIVIAAEQCVGRWTNALIELVYRFATNRCRQWGQLGLSGVLAHHSTDKRQERNDHSEHNLGLIEVRSVVLIKKLKSVLKKVCTMK